MLHNEYWWVVDMLMQHPHISHISCIHVSITDLYFIPEGLYHFTMGGDMTGNGNLECVIGHCGWFLGMIWLKLANVSSKSTGILKDIE